MSCHRTQLVLKASVRSVGKCAGWPSLVHTGPMKAGAPFNLVCPRPVLSLKEQKGRLEEEFLGSGVRQGEPRANRPSPGEDGQL